MKFVNSWTCEIATFLRNQEKINQFSRTLSVKCQILRFRKKAKTPIQISRVVARHLCNQRSTLTYLMRVRTQFTAFSTFRANCGNKKRCLQSKPILRSLAKLNRQCEAHLRRSQTDSQVRWKLTLQPAVPDVLLICVSYNSSLTSITLHRLLVGERAHSLIIEISNF